jgi:hypothetical protein
MPVAPDPVAGERIARHGFADRPARNVVDAVRLTTALQAQDAGAARLGVRARSVGVSEDDVREALDVTRTVVRTWLMRATIHLTAAADVRWLTAVTGPSFARKFATRWRDIGLTPALLERTAATLPEVLAGGPLALAQIMAALAERGIVVDSPDPQAPYHVLLHATGAGLTCRGPERGREATFALIDQWLPGAPQGPRGDEALAELARRYFAAFGPATPADFTAWSGLPSSHAIALIRGELTPCVVAGRAGYTLGDVAPRRGLRLLSAFDNYLVGYRDRTAIIDDEHRGLVYVGGVIKPSVLIDGRVAGIWRLDRTGRKGAATVEVRPFTPLSRTNRAALDAEVADIGRFIGAQTTLDLC